VDDPEALVQRLDLVMTYGTLTQQTRDTILGTLAEIDDPDLALITALYMVYASPEYAVQL